MTNSMYIGSGDIYALLSGKNTKSHQALLRRFVSGTEPCYNAKLSPIDALRTGLILKDRYKLYLPADYTTRKIVRSTKMDVFKCTIDFAKTKNGKIVDFDKLRTVCFADFLKLTAIKNDYNQMLSQIKTKYKACYNQIQEQLFCTELESCHLTFLSVTSYEDRINSQRNILPEDLIRIRIYRDEKSIALIKERGKVFQQIKNSYR